jgi:predicted DNA-binding mobile mystery protein A
MDPRRLKVEQLDRTLNSFRAIEVPPPKPGWIRTIRRALGLTLAQLGERLNISQPSVFDAEKREAAGDITLSQLRRFAAALECNFVYAFVPRRPLGEVLDKRAEEVARKEIERISRSMALEAQETNPDLIPVRITELKQDLLRARWSRLWD